MDITLIILAIALLILIEVSYLVLKTGVRLPLGSRRGVLLDTSALMDGRIVTAAQTGFMPPHVVVPRSVINELQLLADQADPEKRSRARRGLDAVQELQAIDGVRVEVIDDGSLGKGGVDERLIDLAKSRASSICTIDFNLNKAATAMGIRVLNINELAGSIRMAFLPGETISLALTQKGQTGNQAVGYLADGTMVVVDKAGNKIGQTVEIEFIRSLQTAAGRMMFARPVEKDPVAQSRKAPKGRSTVSTQQPETTQKASQSEDSSKEKGRSNDKKVKEVSTESVSPSRPKRRPSKRKTHEDSLIELVNRQQ